MKKGLRHGDVDRVSGEFQSNRRPDEEGIETSATRLLCDSHCNPTADLMKKGLRRRDALRRALADNPTADLMKKGLRPRFRGEYRRGVESNRRPDEEGIETTVQR